MPPLGFASSKTFGSEFS